MKSDNSKLKLYLLVAFILGVQFYLALQAGVVKYWLLGVVLLVLAATEHFYLFFILLYIAYCISH